MKKSILIVMVVMFVLMVSFADNAYALTTVSYKYKTCEVNGVQKRWSADNPCPYDAKNVKIYDDAVKISYNSNGDVELINYEGSNNINKKMKKTSNVYHPYLIAGIANYEIGAIRAKTLKILISLIPGLPLILGGIDIEKMILDNDDTDEKIEDEIHDFFVKHFAINDAKFSTYDVSYLADYYKNTSTPPDTIYVYIYRYDAVGINFYKYVFSTSELNYNPNNVANGIVFEVDDMRVYSTNVGEDNDLKSCPDLEKKINDLKLISEEKGTDSSEFVELTDQLKRDCDHYLSVDEDVTQGNCYSICKRLPSIIENMDPGSYKDTNECGLGAGMVGWILRILKIVRYIVPIIVIVMSTLEYIGAITSANDDAMKKVGARFSKRLFIMILIFLIPSLLQFLFNIFNIDGLTSSNPYCLK